MIKFSVLLSLYIKETPDYLEQSLNSIFEQTVVPSEIILVLDGPITDDLSAVVNRYKDKYSSIFKVISLEKNIGLGAALNEGLNYCTYEYVARMDTDDICKPNRFEKQIAVFEKNPSLSVVGSWVDEFVNSQKNIVSVRKLPQKNSELVNYAKTRNPMNHPAVMFNKADVLAVGGYKDFYLLEDYYLWARLIKENYELYNIQESLLLFRTSPQMIARRGGWKYAQSEIKLFQIFYEMNFISFPLFLKNVIIRGTVRLIPDIVRKYLYRKFLR